MKGTYVIHSEAWYAPHNALERGAVEELNFGLVDDGVVLGEARFTWYDLGRGAATPRLEAFGDAWLMLDHLAQEGFFESLARLDGADVQPQELSAVLREFGFEDATPRSSPHDEETVVGCRLHGLTDCSAPECIGVVRSEVRDAERWESME